MGCEVVFAVTNGRLNGSIERSTELFGTWERISYGQFDGRRRQRVLSKITGE